MKLIPSIILAAITASSISISSNAAAGNESCKSQKSQIQASTQARVVLGDEQFDEYIPLIRGKRIAVLSNQSGIVGDKISGSKLADALKATNGCFMGNSQDAESMIPFLEPSEQGGKIEYGPHLVDVLLEKGMDVRAIFSPEHGFRGNADAGEAVGSSKDPKTGVPILSLFGKGSNIPSKEDMDKFDILLVDIQDVGLRYYTYYITMQHLLDACAIYGKKVIVLDRPNPNGFYVGGPVLDMSCKSGVGSIPVCTVHGMTLGELALMMNGEGWLEGGRKCDITVIPCQNWTHSTKYSLIMPPSPNLKDMKSIYLYASTCWFEGTVVSTGRGTQFPFEVFGYPGMKGYDFSFTPESIPGAKNPKFLGQKCNGRDLRVLPIETIWKNQVDAGYVVEAYTALGMGHEFFAGTSHFDKLSGVTWVRTMIEAGASAKEIESRWSEDVARFKEQRKPYLLYPEE